MLRVNFLVAEGSSDLKACVFSRWIPTLHCSSVGLRRSYSTSCWRTALPNRKGIQPVGVLRLLIVVLWSPRRRTQFPVDVMRHSLTTYPTTSWRTAALLVDVPNNLLTCCSVPHQRSQLPVDVLSMKCIHRQTVYFFDGGWPNINIPQQLQCVPYSLYCRIKIQEWSWVCTLQKVAIQRFSPYTYFLAAWQPCNSISGLRPSFNKRGVLLHDKWWW